MYSKIVAAILLASFQLATAADKPKPGPLTKEERQARAERHDKMAENHRKMAECLRSDKPVSECRDQMRKECPMMTDDGECPMGGGRGRGRGPRPDREGDPE